MTTRSFIKSLALCAASVAAFIKPTPRLPKKLPHYEIISTAFDVATANRWLRDGWKLIGVTTVTHLTLVGLSEKPIYLMGKPRKFPS